MEGTVTIPLREFKYLEKANERTNELLKELEKLEKTYLELLANPKIQVKLDVWQNIASQNYILHFDTVSQLEQMLENEFAYDNKSHNDEVNQLNKDIESLIETTKFANDTTKKALDSLEKIPTWVRKLFI